MSARAGREADVAAWLRELELADTRRRSNSKAVDAEILFELTADGLKEGARLTTRDRERWE